MVFEYDQLPKHRGAIRLLRILPSASSGPPLECEMFNSNCDNSEQLYEALSYTWGNTAISNQISINNTPFLVATNLHDALIELRLTDKPRVLWVDAICINQADLDEQSSQVQLMPLVYANAQQTVVWLGPEGEDSDLGMELLAEINATIDSLPVEQRIVFSGLMSEGEVLPKLSEMVALPALQGLVEPAYALGWIAIDDLLSRPWWGRAWILQEIVLAKEVLMVCGNHSVPWEAITKMSYFSYPQTGRLREMIAAAEPPDSYFNVNTLRWTSRRDGYAAELIDLRLNRTKTRGGTSRTMSTYMELNRERLSKIPHDKIYSLLGLVEEDARNAISVDYKQSVLNVYCEAFEYIVRHEHTLDILGHSQHGSLQSSRPSWLPDWSRPWRSDPISYSPSPDFQASAREHPIVTLSKDPFSFTVRGFVFDTVEVLNSHFRTSM